MSIAIDTSSPLGITLTIFGLLSSGGALTWWWRSGTKVDMADRTATEANKKIDEALPELAALKTQMATALTTAAEAKAKAETLDARVTAVQTEATQHGAVIEEIRTRMAKLDRVDEIVGAVNMMRDVVNKTVPRDEVLLGRQYDAQRFDRLEVDIRQLQTAKD
jgi:chromosome segregation ATPase